ITRTRTRLLRDPMSILLRYVPPDFQQSGDDTCASTRARTQQRANNSDRTAESSSNASRRPTIPRGSCADGHRSDRRDAVSCGSTGCRQSRESLGASVGSPRYLEEFAKRGARVAPHVVVSPSSASCTVTPTIAGLEVDGMLGLMRQ